MLDPKDRRARGLAVYRQMGWGENAGVKELDEDLWQLTTDVLFGEIWARPGLSLRYGDGNNVYDVFHIAASLQHVERLADAHQKRSDRFGSAQFFQKFKRNVAGGKGREYQDVGRFPQSVERIACFQKLLDDGRIRLHFSIDDQIGLFLPGQFNRLFYTDGFRMPGAAEI